MILKNKIAIVTGSTRGIGLAIASSLAVERAKVVINSKDSIEDGINLEKRFKLDGANVKYIQSDVSSEKDVKKLFRETKKIFGDVDILINNAGIYSAEDRKCPSRGTYSLIHKVNGWGVYICSRYAGEFMRDEGVIINISSIYGIYPNPNSILASGVKAEVENYTKAFARKYKGRIRVNAIAPGYTDTKLVRNNFSDKEIKKVIEVTSKKRLLDPKDIADAVISLIKNDGITGQTIVVDGGYTL